MSDQDREYLWRLFDAYWIKENLQIASQIAANVYSETTDLPEDIENHIVSFSSDLDKNHLNETALSCLTKSVLPVDLHVILIAVLVQKSVLGVNKASEQLSGIESSKASAALDGKIRQVLDVAWLTNEDSKDNIMEANADNLLKNALNEVVAAAKKNSRFH